MEELKPVPPAPKKKPNPILRLLAFLLTLALLLGAVALVAYRDRINLDAIKRYFTYRSLERSDSGQIDAFQFDSSGRGGFSSLGDDLLVWSSAGIRLYSPSGVEYLNDALSLLHPVADIRDDAAVVYDAGGTILRVYADRTQIFSLDAEQGHEILSARMGPGRTLAVVTRETGYKGVVTLYGSNFQPTMAIRISTRYIMDAIPSQDGKTTAVLTVGQSNNAFESTLALYDKTGDEAFAQCSLGNNAILDLSSSGDMFWALGETGLSIVSTDGNTNLICDYGGAYLKDYSLGGDGYAALLLGKYRAGSSTTLTTVDSKGETIAALDLEDQILDLAASGRYVAVLTASTLTIYTRDLQPYALLDNTMGARNVVLRSDGTAYLASGETAQLCIPN
ncbi:DUF5711 family protein [uncultured Intestinimonas sp.]|uniref:DUF5711 family protein n=1 Tax=uncultured Intestinimonas sp. TaxID=1689265 RepID=UPI0025E0C38A|nr:DUF5711 family protein [uncultured Intestinimonas sp.]